MDRSRFRQDFVMTETPWSTLEKPHQKRILPRPGALPGNMAVDGLNA
jgi:hypothetical protein